MKEAHEQAVCMKYMGHTLQGTKLVIDTTSYANAATMSLLLLKAEHLRGSVSLGSVMHVTHLWISQLGVLGEA